MSSRAQVYLLALVFIASGIGLTLYKNLALNFPLSPGSLTRVWEIEAKITFWAAQQAITVDLALPQSQDAYQVIDETFASSGYGFDIRNSGEQRRAIWTRREAGGQQTLYYKLKIAQQEARPTLSEPPKASPIPDKLIWSPAQESTAATLITQARALSADPSSFAVQLLKLLKQHESIKGSHSLNDPRQRVSPANLALQLLTRAGLDSHIVRGIRLADRVHNQSPTELLEVFDGQNWHIVEPATASFGLPEDFFIWQRGGDSLLQLEGGRRSKIRFSLIANDLPAKNVALMHARDPNSALIDFNIYSLPVEKQAVFKLLLLVPIGALVVVLFRVLIGIRTSGTFMPVLIAMAFMQTTLLTGVGLLTALVIIGLWIRSYLSQLDLLMVSRIAAVLIVVVILMAILSVVSHKLGLEQMLNMTFFPMVILAWTIERLSITWEEDGAHEVAIQGLGSLTVAIVAYLAMTEPLVGHLTYNFPELLLAVLGVILLLGQYSGYRLNELFRFHSAADQ
ncbi:MAG: inactive transglutaminase family protein [Gammaproteobacteria bacterium]|nr:inactive transglutaminase family protein [Gammaproteobacteria bacterium]MBQ0840885.1 inactive transglutaminase family protein [Gammaproteobacteria bacterium]